MSELLGRALVIDGVAFASIGDVRKWKESSGGAKHMSDVKLIDDYLAKQSSDEEIADIWSKHLATIQDWEQLIKGVDPKTGGCGLVYELPNLIDRPDESFAIADMRQLTMSEPHKHINGETEIYFVLQGEGKIVVGTRLHDLAPGTCIITPPDTMHITLPGKGLVLAVVNTPPFDANNYTPVSDVDGTVVAAKARLRSIARP